MCVFHFHSVAVSPSNPVTSVPRVAMEIVTFQTIKLLTRKLPSGVDPSPGLPSWALPLSWWAASATVTSRFFFFPFTRNAQCNNHLALLFLSGAVCVQHWPHWPCFCLEAILLLNQKPKRTPAPTPDPKTSLRVTSSRHHQTVWHLNANISPQSCDEGSRLCTTFYTSFPI